MSHFSRAAVISDSAIGGAGGAFLASGLVLPVAAVPVELPVSEAELDFAKLPPSRLAAKAAPLEEIEENTDLTGVIVVTRDGLSLLSSEVPSADSEFDSVVDSGFETVAC